MTARVPLHRKFNYSFILPYCIWLRCIKHVREINTPPTPQMFCICKPKDKRMNKNIWSCTTKKIYYQNEHSHMRGMKGIRAIWSAGLLVLQQSNWANQSAAEVWAPSPMPISCRAGPAGWHHGVCFRGDDWHRVCQSGRETCMWLVISREKKSGGWGGVTSLPLSTALSNRLPIGTKAA